MEVLAKEIRKRLQQNQRLSLRRAVFDYLKKNPNIILFYQRQQLFRKSIDAKGEALGFYSRGTESISKGKKGFNDPYTMVDSGSFQRGLFVDVKANRFVISSKSPHLEDILNNEVFKGLELFGLTKDSQRRLMNTHLIPFIRTWIKERYTI